MSYKRSSGKVWTGILAVLLVIVIIGVVAGVGILSDGFKDWSRFETEQEQPANLAEGEQSANLFDAPSVKSVRVSSATVVSSETGVSKKVTAVVEPAAAGNKAVDWSIAWAEGCALESASITDYFIITPDSDGSLSVTVTCLKSFRDSYALLTVTTRDGGFSDSILVTYEGAPAALQISTDNLSSVSGNYYTIGSSESVDLNIDLSNVFGDVGDKFKSYKVDVTSDAQFEFSVVKHSYCDGVDSVSESVSTHDYSSWLESYLAVSVNGETLHIESNGSIESFYRESNVDSTTTGGKTTYTWDIRKFNRWVTDNDGYIEITVSTDDGAVSDSIFLKIVTTVNSVSIDGSVLEF